MDYYREYDKVYRDYYIDWMMVENFTPSRKKYLGAYFTSYEATSGINIQIKPKLSAYKQFVTSVHTLFYILRDVVSS